jgi:transcriptional antiterminator NusG
MKDNNNTQANKQQIRNDERNWYAIHTYSGYENAVIKNLRQRISSIEGMDTKIFDILVPMEKVIKLKNGKKTEGEEPIYPGYVLVDMIVDDESWFMIRNTPRVTGFVGSGNTPVPLTQKEREDLFTRMKNVKTEHKFDIKIGDSVTVSDGPFKGFEGKIEGMDPIRTKLKVLVNMFGRDTSVELDFVQVKAL